MHKCNTKISFPIVEDVGLMRDVCVDIVARNLYNSLNSLENPVSKSCEELGEYYIAQDKSSFHDSCVFDGFKIL